MKEQRIFKMPASERARKLRSYLARSARYRAAGLNSRGKKLKKDIYADLQDGIERAPNAVGYGAYEQFMARFATL